MDKALPEDIRRFILDHIGSVAQLEALLLMQSRPQEAWSAALLARRLYIPVTQTAPILADLAQLGICIPAATQAGHFVYRPATPALAQQVNRLAQYYSQHLITITELIHSRDSRKAQDFSDAFKITKPKEDD